jgi:hypothetical protein
LVEFAEGLLLLHLVLGDLLLEQSLLELLLLLLDPQPFLEQLDFFLLYPDSLLVLLHINWIQKAQV